MAQVSGTMDSSGMSSERTQAGDDPESRVPSETDALNVKHIDLEAGGASSEGGSDADVEKKQTPAVFSAKPKPNLGSGMRLLTLARPEWNMMLVATVALVITQLGSMAVPWYFGKLIDCITDQSIDISTRRSQMRDIVIQLLVILIIASMTLFVRGAIYNAAGERVVARLRIRLFRAILGQEIAFFDSNKTGELLSRLSSDTSKIQDAATTSVSMFLRTCIGLAISLIMLFVTSWKLTLVLCLVVPIIVGCAVTYGRFVKRVAKRYQDALAKAADVSNESIANIRTCRSFAAEDVEINKYRRLIGDPDDASDKLLGWMPKAETTYKLGIYKSLGHGGFLGIIGGVGQIALAGLLWYGGELVISGEITSGKLITFMMYALQVAMSLAVFASLFSSFMEAIGASARTFEIIDRVPALSLRGGQPVGKLNGHVEFENVSFRYPTRPDVVVLDNVSLDIAANTTVALVGQSGGGKSTCISLLERFYEVTAGAIKVDGRDIRTIDPSELRHAMGLVSQEPVLFGVSILENICYGSSTQVTASSDPDVSKYGVPFERVVEVAKMANAYDFIMQFPEGFNTLVGERGIKLSGGQKQRIAIARSLLINPSILLLDEATSALDAQSEELVQDAIEKIMVGRTTIVVAHRLSTIKNADKIVMIKDHRIVDQGKHEELMARCSEYHELVKKQLSKAER